MLYVVLMFVGGSGQGKKKMQLFNTIDACTRTLIEDVYHAVCPRLHGCPSTTPVEIEPARFSMIDHVLRPWR